MAVRLENVGIVVEDLDVATEFFQELGLTDSPRSDRRRAPTKRDAANSCTERRRRGDPHKRAGEDVVTGA
jgi:hypothetical protein